MKNLLRGTLTNQGEDKNFFRTALMWSGSVTPKILTRVFLFTAYSVAAVALVRVIPGLSLPMTPFEYSGAILGMLLVWRVNSGIERWWEARKLWGSIVNQSRNLGIIGYEYTPLKSTTTETFLRWVAAWPHVIRASLRRESSLGEVTRLLGPAETQKLRSVSHMPSYVGAKIARLLMELRVCGLDNFAFQSAERERALLIDAIGGCERILNTPMPLVLAIKTRRFILLFLIFLPFAFFERAGGLTPLFVALVAYPLFSLDEIGAELQNPFSPRNLSHLPLETVCATIESNVLALSASGPSPSPDALTFVDTRRDA